MRHIILAFGLILTAQLVSAYEIEEEERFILPGVSEEVVILSTADLFFFRPLILAFQSEYSINVHYITVSTADLYTAIEAEEVAFDLALSSAMDLQMKLVNDGLAQGYRSELTDSLPGWARWRDQLYAFTQEPAAMILSRAALQGLEYPQTRQEVIQMLRDNPDRFAGRIGTYDVRTSGLGFFFATQDARQSETFWRMMEVMGALNTRLYCCSSQMIEDVEQNEIALAYNVLGSYADGQIEPGDNAMIVPLSDFTNIMMRTGLIPRIARSPERGGAFLDFLISETGQRLLQEEAGFPALAGRELPGDTNPRNIRLGPGLLVYLDRIKARIFLSAWEDAMVQP